MKRIVLGFSAIALAALTAGCGYSEHTYAVQSPTPAYVQSSAYVQGPAPSYERPVAVPGAEYYGDRYYSQPAPTVVYRSY